MKRFFPDKFVLWMIATVILASLLPVRGDAAAAMDAATMVAIFLLFFLHGARLPREALVSGLADWRLHVAILASTYLIFPAAGLALAKLMPGLISAELWTGILFLCALPSTVQSSIAFTAMARGNVAGAVAAAAGSNLLGVFLTPLLVGALVSAQGTGIAFGGIWKIVATLFLPFVLGHALRPFVFPLIAHRPALTTLADKGTILLAVYGAFAAAMVDGLWSRLPPIAIATVALLCLLLLALILAATWAIGRIGGYGDGNRIAILFCGSVKSLASGVSMARILFPGPASSLVILPVMLFHAFQLIVCAWIAARMAGQKVPVADST